MMDSVISVRNLSKMFKIFHMRTDYLKTYLLNIGKARTHEKFYALKNISIDIARGEFVGVIGRNGSGKSTLLKIIVGEWKPDQDYLFPLRGPGGVVFTSFSACHRHRRPPML